MTPHRHPRIDKAERGVSPSTVGTHGSADVVPASVSSVSSTTNTPPLATVAACGGTTPAFPFKLRDMLNDAEKHGWTHIVSWQLNGYAFKVHKPDDFVGRILHLYFRQTKYKSFQRQLNLYGFCRFSKGPYKGCYLHEHFVRSQTDEAMEHLITRRRLSNDSDCHGIQDPQGIPVVGASMPNSPQVVLPSPSFPSAQAATSAPAVDTASELDPIPIEQMNFALPSAAGGASAVMPYAMSSMPMGSSGSNGSTSHLSQNGSQPGNALSRLLDNMMADANSSDGRKTVNAYNDVSIPTTASTARGSKQHNKSKQVVSDDRRAAVATSAFPFKLHSMLTQLSDKRQEHIASWGVNGRAFKIHDQRTFVRDVMPQFFNQTKYESLQRQLNLYGFTRVPKGPMKGFYHHPFFLQHDPSLCSNIVRKKTTGGTGTLLDDIAIPTANAMRGSKFRTAYKALKQSKLVKGFPDDPVAPPSSSLPPVSSKTPNIPFLPPAPVQLTPRQVSVTAREQQQQSFVEAPTYPADDNRNKAHQAFSANVELEPVSATTATTVFDSSSRNSSDLRGSPDAVNEFIGINLFMFDGAAENEAFDISSIQRQYRSSADGADGEIAVLNDGFRHGDHGEAGDNDLDLPHSNTFHSTYSSTVPYGASASSMINPGSLVFGL